MRRTIVAISFCLFSLATSVKAQPVNDLEIYASYCVGALLEFQSKMKPSPDLTDAAVAFLNEMRADYEKRINRFRTYLVARSAFEERRQDLQRATKIAVAKGHADERDCSSSRETCAADCKGPKAKAQSCVMQCMNTDSQSCRSAKRCLEPDNLPF
jgi:hypothetical protein